MLVKDLLTETKFEPIRLLFGDLLVEDLQPDDIQDLLNTLPANQQLLLKVFYRQQLKYRLQVNLSTANIVDISQETPKQVEFQASGGRLRLTHLVLGSRSASKDYVSIEASVNMIESKTNNLDSVSHLYANDCYLVDEDMKYVLEIVDLLPNCSVVDLSFNHFLGQSPTLKEILDGSLIKILQKGHIQIVLIVGNQLASTDRVDFFERITKLDDAETLLTKLIWIPQAIVEYSGWQHLVPGFVNVVRDGHKKYYQVQDQVKDYVKQSFGNRS